ncbi:MAG: hypothetical protein M2R45_04423 [Verrucomicrobia subdivision 3 bacterium]|nr:hypothetical protein [Limisphaerales bacterium]MCS1413511.1 hypothetical protein [Limisphaerales bacterium]
MLSPITKSFLDTLKTDTLPGLGLEPDARPGTKRSDELLPIVEAFAETHRLAESTHALLQSAALLWHDNLEGSHEISQDIKTADGSFLHGIMHRREPDSSNAKYWFTLVGNHPSFPALAKSVNEYAESNHQTSLVDPLIKNGQWDAFAFVDACSRALRDGPESPNYPALQQIQQLEFQSLLNHILT